MNIPDPGKGYRLLKDGESIRVDDHYYDGSQWHSAVHHSSEIVNGGFYRRRIEDRWIPLSERLPNKFPCQLIAKGVLYVGTKTTQGYEVIRTDGHGYTWLSAANDVTHWKPLQLSDPPEAEASEDETAFVNWVWKSPQERNPDYEAAKDRYDLARLAWHAACRYATGKKSP